MPHQQHQQSATNNRSFTGRISALSASLRGRQEGEGNEGRESAAPATAIEPSRGHFAGRAGLGNYFNDNAQQQQDEEFPWPRGRQRTRGSHSTGRGGYGNIAAAQAHSSHEWAYSNQEQEILRAHADARRMAIPVGRGGYGNIAHARALAAATATRSQSIDPVTAPTAMSFRVPLPVPGYRARPKLNAKECYYGSDAEDSESDSD
ncbi:hypothetical protein MIND_00636500 [Mycena indigotica]|uniref:Uncharacterized protein n=1 Tax=Mycena indigotica TaxID=2126181 RepID=A0A8H6W3Y3_9AGAR|nr:uncharacterized protein MIND_00636500 [Mycena indigotica]KAF7304052.1 hypothetical protein MIND_00636500 [Mycena indigotica]